MTQQTPPDTNPPPAADLCYSVLTPFKFRGVVIKPPAFVQLDADEADEYIAAGVLGADGVERPDNADIVVATNNPTTTSEGADPPAAGGAAGGGARKSATRVVRKSARRKG